MFCSSGFIIIRNGSTSLQRISKFSNGFRFTKNSNKSRRYFFSKAKRKDYPKKQEFIFLPAMAKKIVTLIRVPFIAYAMYNLGLQRGTIDYARDPKKSELEVMNAVLGGVPFVNHRQITEGFDYDKEMYSFVQSNGRLIIRAALRFAKKELEAALVAQEEDKKSLLDAMKDGDSDFVYFIEWFLGSLVNFDSEEVTFWKNVISHLEDPDSWRVFLVDSPDPKAFVSEMIPRCIFVTTSFMNKYIENKHELGLVFGHEISHLIYNHNTSSIQNDFSLRIIELLVIALDPFDGKTATKYSNFESFSINRHLIFFFKGLLVLVSWV